MVGFHIEPNGIKNIERIQGGSAVYIKTFTAVFQR